MPLQPRLHHSPSFWSRWDTSSSAMAPEPSPRSRSRPVGWPPAHSSRLLNSGRHDPSRIVTPAAARIQWLPGVAIPPGAWPGVRMGMQLTKCGCPTGQLNKRCKAQPSSGSAHPQSCPPTRGRGLQLRLDARVVQKVHGPEHLAPTGTPQQLGQILHDDSRLVDQSNAQVCRRLVARSRLSMAGVGTRPLCQVRAATGGHSPPQAVLANAVSAPLLVKNHLFAIRHSPVVLPRLCTLFPYMSHWAGFQSNNRACSVRFCTLSPPTNQWSWFQRRKATCSVWLRPSSAPRTPGTRRQTAVSCVAAPGLCA